MEMFVVVTVVASALGYLTWRARRRTRRKPAPSAPHACEGCSAPCTRRKP